MFMGMTFTNFKMPCLLHKFKIPDSVPHLYVYYSTNNIQIFLIQSILIFILNFISILCLDLCIKQEKT